MRSVRRPDLAAQLTGEEFQREPVVSCAQRNRLFPGSYVGKHAVLIDAETGEGRFGVGLSRSGVEGDKIPVLVGAAHKSGTHPADADEPQVRADPAV